MKNLIVSSVLAVALLASATAANAQQNARYCWLSSDSGGLSCAYYTMSQCYRSLPGADTTGTCVRNPRLYRQISYRRFRI
jgi:opacity protein-like surface antigen